MLCALSACTICNGFCVFASVCIHETVMNGIVLSDRAIQGRSFKLVLNLNTLLDSRAATAASASTTSTADIVPEPEEGLTINDRWYTYYLGMICSSDRASLIVLTQKAFVNRQMFTEYRVYEGTA